MHIGPIRINSKAVLAPMAGVTDKPFRKICRGFGAGMAVSEMISSKPDLRL
ncbi:MAG: tRNA-dihydrouridine synthase, partial [Gammaproteobacteria bacterium]